MSNNQSGIDKFFEGLSTYKDFAIKFTALMFHDDIIPDDGSGNHIHQIETWVFWILVVLSVPTVMKLFLSILSDLVNSWRKLWHWKEH